MLGDERYWTKVVGLAAFQRRSIRGAVRFVSYDSTICGPLSQLIESDRVVSQACFLIVDDDELVCCVLQRTVARYVPHAAVHTAASVAEARLLLSQTPLPQIVITDYHLADGSGLDVLQAAGIRDQEPRVVVISADPQWKDTVLAAGAVAFLAKPFRINDILNLLRTNPSLALS